MTADTDPAWRGLDPALLVLRRWEWGVTVAVLTAVAAVLLAHLYSVAGLVGALLGGAAVLGVALPAVARRFAAWSWTEREDDLLLRRGVLLQRTSVVPYGRMQFVDVTAGPLDRRFGLATVVLHTAAAASDARIPGLGTAEAARLRDRLAALGEARAAGL